MKINESTCIALEEKEQIERYISNYKVPEKEETDIVRESYIEALNMRDLLGYLNEFTVMEPKTLMSNLKNMMQLAIKNSPQQAERFINTCHEFDCLTLGLTKHNELIARKYFEYDKLSEIMEPSVFHR